MLCDEVRRGPDPAGRQCQRRVAIEAWPGWTPAAIGIAAAREGAPVILQRVGKCVLRNVNSGATNLKYAPLLQPCPCAECILRIAYGTTDL